MKALNYVAVLTIAILLAACAEMPSDGKTMRGGPPEATMPALPKTVAEVPAGQKTYHYKVDIYPGLDENYDPDPKLTLVEYRQIAQLDHFCAKRVDDLSGQLKEMLKQGGLYGGLQGIFGAMGAKLGFGSLIRPMEYLTYIALTGFGGGLASGKITYDMMLAVAHGYCMTGMVYKADRLEGKLARIFITPLYTGEAKVPEVSDKPAPTYLRGSGERFIPPPPR